MVSAVAAKPTIIEILVPQIVSESTERPRLSVPNRNLPDGDAYCGLFGWQVGERSQWLARRGAKIATRMKKIRIPSPIIPILFLRNIFHTRPAAAFRRALAIA